MSSKRKKKYFDFLVINHHQFYLFNENGKKRKILLNFPFLLDHVSFPLSIFTTKKKQNIVQ